MKIAFDAKRAFLNRSGLGNYSRDVIRGLQQYFPENHYTLYTPAADTTLFEPNRQNTSTILPPEGYGKIRQAYWRTFQLPRQIKTDGQDIYHGLSNELPRHIHRAGVKSVVTIHDLIFMRYPHWYHPVDREIYQRKFSAASYTADQIIAVSLQTKADLVHYFGVPPERVQVIYQSCNLAFYTRHSIEELEQLRKTLQLPSEFLLYVGTIEARKNLLSLVKALHEHAIGVPLVVLGRATGYAKLVKQYIAQHSIRQVHFLEQIPFTQFPMLYQMAQALVYPSVFEGFGIPILEALVSGTPVITSLGGCFAEAGGTESVYVNPQNVEQLSDAIQRVLGNTELRQNMQQAGWEHAKKFDAEVLTRQMMKVYTQLVS